MNPDDPKTMDLLDRIVGTKEYSEGAYISNADAIDHVLKDEKAKVTVYYGSNIYNQKITREEASELLALYREDVRECRFSDLRSNIPTGSLRIGMEKRDTNYTSYRESEVKIYPFYTRCVEYLKDKELYMETFLKPEDVEKIQVTNYNYEIQKQKQGDADVPDDYGAKINMAMTVGHTDAEETSEYIRNAVYDQEEDIRELCDKLYPSDWICSGWSMGADAERDYSVTVYFKPEKSVDGMGVAYFTFLDGETPEFVQADTLYEE